MIIGVRPDQTRPGRKIGEGAHQPGSLGLRHVEDKNLVVIQPARPQEAAVIGEPHVVRFTAPGQRYLVDDLAVARGLGIGIDRDQFVVAVTEPGNPERPDVHEVLLPFDQARDVGRVAGLVCLSRQAASKCNQYRGSQT